MTYYLSFLKMGLVTINEKEVIDLKMSKEKCVGELEIRKVRSKCCNPVVIPKTSF